MCRNKRIFLKIAVGKRKYHVTYSVQVEFSITPPYHIFHLIIWFIKTNETNVPDFAWALVKTLLIVLGKDDFQSEWFLFNYWNFRQSFLLVHVPLLKQKKSMLNILYDIKHFRHVWGWEIDNFKFWKPPWKVTFVM